jgi:pimeloyl-ACP methyl ester carboxylesterase
LDELRVDVAGRRLLVRGWGEPDATPVLCWHGVGLVSKGGLYWAEAAPLLAGDGLRILGVDAPGFGESPALEPRDYHPHVLADLVPLLLDALGLERAAFMGFSWGGDVGCHLAARHPDRLTALVVLDAGYRDPPFDPALPYEGYVERNERKAADRDTTVAPWVVAAAEHGMAQAMPSTTRLALAASGLPVLIVAAGDASDVDLAGFASDVPQAEVRRIDGAGHDVLGDGGPDVVRAVARWIVHSAQPMTAM